MHDHVAQHVAARACLRGRPCRWITASLLLAVPGVALASNFSILMVFLLVPFGISTALVWSLTWWATARMKPALLKTAIRGAGACLVLTPTYTAGGNGQMLSVALYDIVLSALGGDPIYASHALAHAGISTTMVVFVACVRARLPGKGTGTSQ